MLLSRFGGRETEQATTLLRRLLRAGGSARSRIMRNWGVIGGVAAALAAGLYVLWGPMAERKRRRKGEERLGSSSGGGGGDTPPGNHNRPKMSWSGWSSRNAKRRRSSCCQRGRRRRTAESWWFACRRCITQLGSINSASARRRFFTYLGLVPGLLNLGNTCFMNSLLQGLSACPSLIQWLEGFASQDAAGQNRRAGQQSLSLTLLRLLKALSCREVMEEDLLDASCLLEVLRLHRWQISSFEEQDAHELFHVLTSSLEEEREGQAQIPHLFDVHSLEEPEIPQEQICCRTKGPLHPVPNRWKCQHPFHGRLTSNMVCKHCKHQSPLRYDTFDSLSLSIPATVWGHPLTLDHCLRHFISSELVKDVVCDNCTKIQAEGTEGSQTAERQRTTFVKQLKLGKLPQCLCIHLQRLSWSSRGSPLKRNEHVQFSEFLILDLYKQHFPTPKSSPREGRQAEPGPEDDVERTLANGTCCAALRPPSIGFPFMAVPGCGSPIYVYRLMAVVVHHGDMHSGHFVTYRRSPSPSRTPLSASSQWLWISDDLVRKSTLQEVLSSSAYLLFYERIGSRLQHPSREFQAEE